MVDMTIHGRFQRSTPWWLCPKTKKESNKWHSWFHHQWQENRWWAMWLLDCEVLLWCLWWVMWTELMSPACAVTIGHDFYGCIVIWSTTEQRLRDEPQFCCYSSQLLNSVVSGKDLPFVTGWLGQPFDAHTPKSKIKAGCKRLWAHPNFASKQHALSGPMTGAPFSCWSVLDFDMTCVVEIRMASDASNQQTYFWSPSHAFCHPMGLDSFWNLPLLFSFLFCHRP